jgi:RimJ/RimL family protein N-acetyltransferase
VSSVALGGYRDAHAPLLEGSWIRGELLCFAQNELRSPLATRTVEPPDGSRDRLLIAPKVGFVRFADLEPVHRRARLEIGIQGSFHAGTATALLALAREAAYEYLNLERLYGWVRGGHEPTRRVLAAAGFELEATVPQALRAGGRLAAREIWGDLRRAAS